MKTRSLLKLSLVIALIGTFIIIILANNLEPSITSISNINEKMIDEWVSVKGNITNQKSMNGLTIFTIYDGTAGIRVIMYKEIKKNMKGSEITILGKVIEYKNEIEIQIEKIGLIE